MYDQGNIVLALLLSTIAGLSTGIGSTLAFFIHRPKKEYLCFSLGLSGGVMIYVSFIELLPEAIVTVGEIIGLYAFFTGFIIMGIVDILIPEEENPHAFKGFDKTGKHDKSLLRVGMLTALAVAIHNFPEGFATFGSALSDVRVGVLIAFAVAIHNIPEGISVYMPIFYATGDKRKAFFYSFLSGVAEPIAAIIGLVILLPFFSDELLAVMLAFVAGIMVYISVDELLPVARQYESGHCAILGIMFGMFIMAVSLLFL